MVSKLHGNFKQNSVIIPKHFGFLIIVCLLVIYMYEHSNNMLK